MEEKNFPREDKIRQILEQEIRDGEDMAAEARKLVEYLLLEKKGYSREDVLKGAAFEVTLGQETVWSSVDFIVSVEGRKAMIIKCAAGSLDSRRSRPGARFDGGRSVLRWHRPNAARHAGDASLRRVRRLGIRAGPAKIVVIC